MKKILTTFFFISSCFLMAVNAQTDNDLKLIFDKCMIQAELQSANQQSPSSTLKIDIVKNIFFNNKLYNQWEDYAVNHIDNSKKSSAKNYIEFIALEYKNEEVNVEFKYIDNLNSNSWNHKYLMYKEHDAWRIRENKTTKISTNKKD